MLGDNTTKYLNYVHGKNNIFNTDKIIFGYRNIATRSHSQTEKIHARMACVLCSYNLSRCRLLYNIRFVQVIVVQLLKCCLRVNNEYIMLLVQFYS